MTVPTTDLQTIKIENIRVDGGTQSRIIENEETINDYADAMKSGAVFPPVVLFFDETDYWLADGFHRLAALKKNGFQTVKAEIQKGTRRDAILHSVGANATHGLRRTNSDKRNSVMILLKDSEWSQWSDREIARRCCVDHKTVSKYRDGLSGENPQIRKVERNGTSYTQDTTNVGVKKTKPALPETAEPFLIDAVDSGKISVEDAKKVDHALNNGMAEPVKVAVIEHQLTNPKQVTALAEAHKENPRFVQETLERGFVVDLDGDDVPIAEADPTLLRLTASEDEYERVKRQETYISENRKRNTLTIGSSESNEWYTPPQYIESARKVLGTIDLDPASNDAAQEWIQAKQYYTAVTNGIDKDWHGRIWLNPPYGKENNQFIEKLMGEIETNRVREAIVLVNSHATDTKWFQPLWSHTLCFTNHRINFIPPEENKSSGSTHGSVFIYIGHNVDLFASEFSQYGVIVRQYISESVSMVA